MAGKTPRAPRTSSGVSNKYIKEKTGFRPLTQAELAKVVELNRKSGWSNKAAKTLGSRAYTSQKEGVKKLDLTKVVSRRDARQAALTVKRTLNGMGDKVTLEREAKRNKNANRGRNHQTVYSQTLKDYAALTGRKKGELRKDPEFRRLYKDYSNESRSRAATRRRLEALRVLDPINSEYYSRLLERY